MFVQYFILVFLWILFALFHSIFASEKCKKLLLQLMKKRYKYYRMLYSIFALLNVSSIVAYHFTINSFLLWQQTTAETIIAITGIIVGGAVMIFFTGKFFFELSGADILKKTKKSDTLIKTSLYNYVRHPLYTATLLLIWSIFFLHPLLSNLLSCLCITVYTIIGIHFEEKKLIKNFGFDYIQYKRKTPMLIPKFL